MILSPLAGIMLNLVDSSIELEYEVQNNVVEVFASMGCTATIQCGLQYLLEYNWVSSHKLKIFHTFVSVKLLYSSIANTSFGLFVWMYVFGLIFW